MKLILNRALWAFFVAVTVVGCVATVQDLERFTGAVVQAQEERDEELRELIAEVQADGSVTSDELATINAAMANLSAEMAEKVYAAGEATVADIKARGENALRASSAIIPGAPGWLDPALSLGGALFAIRQRHRLKPLSGDGAAKGDVESLKAKLAEMEKAQAA